MQLIISRDLGAVTINGRTHVVDCTSLPDDIAAVKWFDDHGELYYRNGRITGIGDIQPFRAIIDLWNDKQQRLSTR